MRYVLALLCGTAALPLVAQAPSAKPVKVVTSLTVYASIAREIVGDRGTVTAIAHGDENPHYVQPKPSFVPLLGGADVFVTTGLDLELWVPALLDKANNSRVSEGGPGYVSASAGLDLLDMPTSFSRTQGDIHVYGNPHIWTDPLNAVQIARNILAGLNRVSPANATFFTAREKDFEERIYRALFGDELVRLIGGATLAKLDRDGKLFDFLRTQRYQGAALADKLGGWLREGLVFRNKEIVCYHKEWDYFSRQFGIPCIDYIEPKPGIPPTPRHVQEVITIMRDRGVRVLFSTNYYDRNQVQQVAARNGAAAVIVPSTTTPDGNTDTYDELVSRWIDELARAYGGAASTGTGN
jgi:ABC-type Zn uptake system ZnuABC Zn-binding protein ZnuA